jgi:hypothetical protein
MTDHITPAQDPSDDEELLDLTEDVRRITLDIIRAGRPIFHSLTILQHVNASVLMTATQGNVTDAVELTDVMRERTAATIEQQNYSAEFVRQDGTRQPAPDLDPSKHSRN